MATPPYDHEAQDALLTGQVLTREHCVALFEPEALVAGMAATPDGPGARLFRALGVDPAAVHRAAEQALAGLPRADQAGEVAVASPHLRGALAEAESEVRGGGTVGLAELLVGILVAGGTPIARALAQLGVSPAAVRGARSRLAAEAGSTPEVIPAAHPAPSAASPAAGRFEGATSVAGAGAPDAAPVEVDALLAAVLRTTRLAVDAIADELQVGGFGAPTSRARIAADWAAAAPALLAELSRLRPASDRD